MDYRFVDTATFNGMIERGEFLLPRDGLADTLVATLAASPPPRPPPPPYHGAPMV